MSTFLNFYKVPVRHDGCPDVQFEVRCLVSERAMIPGNNYYESVVIFDKKTTPPTLVRGSWADMRYWFGKHPDFPELYIDPSGNIGRTSDNSIVMKGPS